MGRELIVLGLAFLLAGLLARIGRRIGLPTIPLFVGAGILAGPNTPGPVLFAHPEDLELLAAFGLIFLLFYLGVEFSLEDLTSGGRTLLTSAALYLTLNIGAGLLLGFAIGWGTKEAFIIAGATGISSSAIVTKLLVELRRLRNPETSLILGIIVLEDLFLALYLAALAPVLGTAANTGEAVLLFVRALAFLIALGLLARYGRAVVGRVISAPDDK
ncbi:MAG: cation:proton antiporter, partial [Ilumatobacteraceae bacterium]